MRGDVTSAPSGKLARLTEGGLVEAGEALVDELGALVGPAERVLKRACHQLTASLTTTFSKRPMPAISATTVSPPTRYRFGVRACPTPPGVPVAMMSPGLSRTMVDTYCTSATGSKSRSAVVSDCITSPSTLSRTS